MRIPQQSVSSASGVNLSLLPFPGLNKPCTATFLPDQSTVHFAQMGQSVYSNHALRGAYSPIRVYILPATNSRLSFTSSLCMWERISWLSAAHHILQMLWTRETQCFPTQHLRSSSLFVCQVSVTAAKVMLLECFTHLNKLDKSALPCLELGLTFVCQFYPEAPKRKSGRQINLLPGLFHLITPNPAPSDTLVPHWWMCCPTHATFLVCVAFIYFYFAHGLLGLFCFCCCLLLFSATTFLFFLLHCTLLLIRSLFLQFP